MRNLSFNELRTPPEGSKGLLSSLEKLPNPFTYGIVTFTLSLLAISSMVGVDSSLSKPSLAADFGGGGPGTTTPGLDVRSSNANLSAIFCKGSV